MIQWLKEYGFLAGWLTLPLSVVLFLAQNSKSHFRNIDWSRSLIYLAFSIALGMAFTPGIDEHVRLFAQMVAFSGMMFLIVDRKPRS
jgi:hypothetical protein